MKVKTYSAVIENRDMIRVSTVSVRDAVRQIASHCEVGEVFSLNGSTYRVNGRLAKSPASKVRKES